VRNRAAHTIQKSDWFAPEIRTLKIVKILKKVSYRRIDVCHERQKKPEIVGEPA